MESRVRGNGANEQKKWFAKQNWMVDELEKKWNDDTSSYIVDEVSTESDQT